jgi:transposase-like protein
MEKIIFTKNCPNCRDIQSYTTKFRLESSIKENWVCNKCSSIRNKKTYDDNIINDIIEQYNNGVNFSKIALKLKICKNNIKKILIEKNIWVDGRDKIKKDFNDDEINNIINKYVNEGLSCSAIAKYYNVSKGPINRVLKEKGLLREGLSDGKKIELTNKQFRTIENLYLNEYKNCEDISQIMGLNIFFINKILSKTGFRRTKSEGASVGGVKKFRNIRYDEYLTTLSEFKNYRREVISITKKQPIYELSNFDKRGVSGIDGNFHLDHKFSIVEGFKQKIDPNIIGGIKNLEFIPWKENVMKRTNCSINITELIN